MRVNLVCEVAMINVKSRISFFICMPKYTLYQVDGDYLYPDVLVYAKAVWIIIDVSGNTGTNATISQRRC